MHKSTAVGKIYSDRMLAMCTVGEEEDEFSFIDMKQTI